MHIHSLNALEREVHQISPGPGYTGVNWGVTWGLGCTHLADCILAPNCLDSLDPLDHSGTISHRRWILTYLDILDVSRLNIEVSRLNMIIYIYIYTSYKTCSKPTKLPGAWCGSPSWCQAPRQTNLRLAHQPWHKRDGLKFKILEDWGLVLLHTRHH